tara:strand:+ start:113 stop:751 length:639 start_codon:yes stop_codon:yes gene_type:complete
VDLNYSTHLIFPTCIHSFESKNFESIKDELVQHVYKERDRDPKGSIISNKGGWQSKCFINNDKIFSIIGSIIFELPILNEEVDFNMSYWFNINKKGDSNTLHTHPGCDLSGVFWLKTSRNCGNIVFESPYNFSSYMEIISYTKKFKYDTGFTSNMPFNPIEGKMLVFPSSLQHHVQPNESDEDRISISFNIKLLIRGIKQDVKKDTFGGFKL